MGGGFAFDFCITKNGYYIFPIAPLFSGNANNGSNCGVFSLNVNNGASNVNSNIGGQVCFYKYKRIRIIIFR